MPALPPQLSEAEGKLGEPHERQAEHPEEHPRANPPRRRLADERRALDRVDPEGDELGDQCQQRIDPEECLVARPAVELLLGEELRRIEVREGEVAGDARLPELEEGEDPRGDGDADAHAERNEQPSIGPRRLDQAAGSGMTVGTGSTISSDGPLKG